MARYSIIVLWAGLLLVASGCKQRPGSEVLEDRRVDRGFLEETLRPATQEDSAKAKDLAANLGKELDGGRLATVNQFLASLVEKADHLNRRAEEMRAKLNTFLQFNLDLVDTMRIDRQSLEQAVANFAHIRAHFYIGTADRGSWTAQQADTYRKEFDAGAALYAENHDIVESWFRSPSFVAYTEIMNDQASGFPTAKDLANAAATPSNLSYTVRIFEKTQYGSKYSVSVSERPSKPFHIGKLCDELSRQRQLGVLLNHEAVKSRTTNAGVVYMNRKNFFQSDLDRIEEQHPELTVELTVGTGICLHSIGRGIASERNEASKPYTKQLMQKIMLKIGFEPTQINLALGLFDHYTIEDFLVEYGRNQGRISATPAANALRNKSRTTAIDTYEFWQLTYLTFLSEALADPENRNAYYHAVKGSNGEYLFKHNAGGLAALAKEFAKDKPAAPKPATPKPEQPRPVPVDPGPPDAGPFDF